MKVLLFVIILNVTLGFQKKNSSCTSCKLDAVNSSTESRIYFFDEIPSKIEGVNSTNIFVQERNLFTVKSNCNEGERMDKYGRCRESFK
jgi:hypothetical protein